MARLELGFEHTDLITVAQDKVLLRTLQRKFGIRNCWDVFGAAVEVLRLGEREDVLEGAASDVSKDPTNF